MSCLACFNSTESSTTVAPEPISKARILGGSIAALVAAVALVTFVAILAAPHAAFIAAVTTALGGKAAALAVSGTLFTIGSVVGVLIFSKPKCAENKETETPTNLGPK